MIPGLTKVAWLQVSIAEKAAEATTMRMIEVTQVMIGRILISRR